MCAQPTAYTRQFNFTNFEATQPFDPLPGSKVDLELNAIKTTLTETLTNLDLIQRDDGQLENRSVGVDQLRNDALTQLGLLTKQVVNEFVYDIAAPAITTLSGADRNGKVLAYAVGAQISVHIDGIKTDPANITATDGINIVHSPAFPNPSVVTVEVGEAATVATVDVESLDDISGSFDGILATFPMTVGGQARSAEVAERLTVSLDDVVQEPTAKFTVTGTNITFITPPAGGTVFWAKLRTLKTFENGDITGGAGGDIGVQTVTGGIGGNIALNTITTDNLAFTISTLEIGSGIDWYDDVLPAGAPANTYVFPVGQTIGKTGSGASLQDDDFEEVFDIMKKRWGNIGTEDFDSLDVVALPDLRGTQFMVPDKGKLKVLLLNAIGDQSGIQQHNVSTSVSTSAAGGNTGFHTLTSSESGVPVHNHPIQTDTAGGGSVEIQRATSGGSANQSFNTIDNVAANASSSHLHSIGAIASTGTGTQTGILHLDPYTMVEKIIRLK